MYKYVTNSVEYKDVPIQFIFLEKDFFYPLFSKFINQFSSNFYFVTICFTLIYFTVYYKCVEVVSKSIRFNYKSYLPWYYVFSLYTVFPFTAVTAFRFNLAVLYFSWCLLELAINDNKKFLYYVLLTPFIHFSFLIYLILPFVFLLLKNKKHMLNISVVIFATSFLFLNSNLSSFANEFSNNYLSESVAKQVEEYVSDDGIVNNNERYKNAEKYGSTRRAINRGIIFYSRQILMFSLVFFILLRKKYLDQNRFYGNFFVLILLSYSATNIFSSILHGSRFFSVSNILYYFLIFYLLATAKLTDSENKNFYRTNKLYYNFVSIIIFLSFLNTTYMAKTIFNFPNLFLGNWLTSFYYFSYFN
jgi:hypothetical protein